MLDRLLDIVFPPRCGGCRGRGQWFCAACSASVRLAPLWACRRCHRAVSLDPCPMCEAGEGPDSMIALARLEGPVREAVHALKYGDRPHLAPPMIEATWQPGRLAPGVVVPVPLHPARLSSRGYNQACLLALALARRTGGTVFEGLERGGVGGRQVGRGGQERRVALRGVFKWAGGPVPPAVVIVDDVLTTGATLLECALVARAAGARRVDTLAITLG
ncbi:MAG: phosphoribosyltransferase family protein [Candidatus Dormibacteria bacterium]